MTSTLGFGEQAFGTSPFGAGQELAEPPYEPLTPLVDWQIHPRNADLTRSYDPVSGWSSLVLVERLNTPDTWTVTGPADALGVFVPGMGCILERDDVQIASGQVTSINRSGAVEDGRTVETMTVGFTSDLERLGWRIVLPTHTHVLTGDISKMPDAYATFAASAETLLLHFIDLHLGPDALAGRQIDRFRVPASQGRGGRTQVSGRLDSLGRLVHDIAEVANLRVNIVHTEDDAGAWLDLTVDAVADLSADVRFGTAESTAAGLITEWSYDLSAPTVTRAVVAGAGQLANREFLQRTSSVAESLWRRSVEMVVDQRQVDPASAEKLSEYVRAADEALAEGAGPTAVSFVPTLGPDLEYRRDVTVGDIVGYDLPGLDPAQDKVREATTTVTVEGGQPTERVAVVVGTPDAPQLPTQYRIARALRAVNAIQRST